MNSIYTGPIEWSVTTRFPRGWHRTAALAARVTLARTLYRESAAVVQRELLPAEYELRINVQWYSHEGTDRGHLAPTVRTVRNDLTAAGINLTHASITPRIHRTAEALSPTSPSWAFPAVLDALTPRIVVDVLAD